MKNLKKALVLVLAFAMVFGMFTIGASAATSFNDDEDIVNKEAVSAMTQLGIINGYDDGTFLPKENVTRAQMCKMICVALNGGNAPLLDAGVTVFSDTVGHWASAYINYCYAEGIVSGDAGKGGTFRPEAPVTALEAAKMMLVALGYNAQAAGFTGADWAQNVAKEANRKGLFDGIGALNANAPLTRDNAAQLIYNGINATLVEYQTTFDTRDGQLVTIPKIKDLDGKTIISEKFKAVRVEGIVTDNEYLTASKKGETTLEVKSDTDFVLTSGKATFKVSTGADVIGKRIVLYVKPSVTDATNSLKATVVGTPAISDTNKIYTTAKAVTATNIEKTLSDNGLKFENGNITLIKNGSVNTSYPVNTNSYSGEVLNTAGVEAQYIDNTGDGVIDVVVKTEYSFGVVEKVGTNALKVKKLSSSSYGTAGFDINDAKDKVVNFTNLGLAKDDYVKFVTVSGKHYVEKVSGVTVTVKSTKGNNAIIATDGKTYEKSALADKLNAADKTNLIDTVVREKAAVLYLDLAGNVLYVTDVTTTSETKYLMILDLAESSDPFTSKLLAKVVFDDGTTSTVTIAQYDLKPSGTSNVKVIGKDISAGDAISQTGQLGECKIATATYDKSKVFAYKVNSDGEYSLTVQATVAEEIGSNGIVANKPVIVDGSLIANSSTNFIIKNLNGDSFATYKGIANVATRAADTTNKLYVWAVTEDNSNVAKVVFAQGGKSASTTATEVIYVLDNEAIVSGTDEKPVYSYKVVRNGVVEEIKGKNEGVFAAGTGIYDNITYVNGVIDEATKVTTGAMTATDVNFAGNGIIGNQDGTFTYNDSTKFFVVKNKEATVATIDDIVTEDTVDKIAIVADADTNVALYVFIVRP